MRIKQPAVAGMFYPDDPEQLRQLVGRLLQENPQQGGLPKAILVPHAGLVYSGGVAARAYNLIRPWLKSIKRIVMLGPSHRVALRGMAVMDADAWHTPLGDISLDTEYTKTLVELGLVGIANQAHAQEHCLEVQLPFLQQLQGRFKLVPVVVGQAGAEQVAKLVEEACNHAGTLVLISSDLSHFHSYEEAREIDLNTMNRISARMSDIQPQQACGCYALNGLLNFAAKENWQAEQLAYCNSGDTAGDHSRVVGYTAYAFH